MTLRPGASVTGASSTGDIDRAKPPASNAGSENAAPSDGIHTSAAFETLTFLNANHATKLARVATAVQSGTYLVDSAAVSKSIVEDAVA